MTTPQTKGLPRDHRLLAEHRIGLAVAAIFLGSAAVLFVLVGLDATRPGVQEIDDAVRDAAQSMQWGPFTVVALALNYLGSWYVTWPLRAVVAAWLWVKHRREAFWVWVTATLIYEPLVGVIKDVYERSRPPDPAVAVTGWSFPSGHATVGAAVAIGLVIVLVPAGPSRRRLELFAGVFAFFMASSRVYLDAHWFTDVVAGTALGAAVMLGTAATIHELGDRLHDRRLARNQGAASGDP